MIRVLNIIGNLDCGGRETSIMNYYRHIDRSEIQYDFLFTTDNYVKQYYEDEAVSLGARFFVRNTRKHPFLNIRQTIKIFKENPDIRIVHIYDEYSVKPTYDSLLALLCKIPVRIVYSSSDIRSIAPVMHKIFRPVLRLTATHCLAGSREAGISMFGVKVKNNITYVKRAREPDLFRFNPEKRHIIRENLQLGDCFTVVHTGRMVVEKNQAFLLEAFAAAHKKQPQMILVMAGDGELHETLVMKAGELGISNAVKFLGLRDDIPDLLQAADLFVLPSLCEGLPGAAVEAQAAGLPCLLSDTITPESKLIDPVEFLPINKGSGIWAERMLAYQNFERKDTFEELRSAGYDIKDASKRLEEFYRQTLNTLK